MDEFWIKRTNLLVGLAFQFEQDLDWLAILCLVDRLEFVRAVRTPSRFLMKEDPQSEEEGSFMSEAELRQHLLLAYFRLFILSKEREVECLLKGLPLDDLACAFPNLGWRYIERIPEILDVDPDEVLEYASLRILLVRIRLASLRPPIQVGSRNAETNW